MSLKKEISAKEKIDKLLERFEFFLSEKNIMISIDKRKIIDFYRFSVTKNSFIESLNKIELDKNDKKQIIDFFY